MLKRSRTIGRWMSSCIKRNCFWRIRHGGRKTSCAPRLHRPKRLQLVAGIST
ncbi:unnamed protein product [Durusdinium trenchii]|uniref:Uncharacterized protein n=1 Tax=Durusdinium trenchii TaxID=1381693 RepID=A0ABP0LAG2_9DINO